MKTLNVHLFPEYNSSCTPIQVGRSRGLYNTSEEMDTMQLEVIAVEQICLSSR